MQGIELTVAEGLYEAWKKSRPLTVRLVERLIEEGESRKSVVDRLHQVARRIEGAEWIVNDLEQVVDYIIHQRKVTA
jgi:hypothetical protein